MRVVVFGDSHTKALSLGWKRIERTGAPDGVDARIFGTIGPALCKPFFADRGDHIKLEISGADPADCRFPPADEVPGETVYGLLALLHSARVWRHKQWERYAPLPVSGNVTPVSAALVRRLALDDQHYMLQLLDAMLRLKLKVFAIEAPAIFAHHPLAQSERRDTVMAVDRIYRAAILAELERRKVPVLRLPPDSVSEDGFMEPRYRSNRTNDNHHANSVFGRLLMERMLPFIDGQVRP